MKGLPGLAALALVVVTAVGCSGSTSAVPRASPAEGSSGTSTFPGGGTAASSPPASTGHGGTPTVGTSSPPAAGSARTLPLPALVREHIIGAWVAGVGLERSDVAGTQPGLTYYGYLPSTKTYWAIADFDPTDSWRRRVKASPNSRAAVQFQGSPYVFSREQGQGWRFLGDTGGVVCPPNVPAPMIAVWGLPTESC